MGTSNLSGNGPFDKPNVVVHAHVPVAKANPFMPSAQARVPVPPTYIDKVFAPIREATGWIGHKQRGKDK